MAHPTRERVLALGERITRGSVSHLGILGGEPLSHPDIVAVLNLFIEHGLHATISTNGLFMPHGLVNVLKESCQWSVFFSIDGPTAGTHDAVRGKGSFDKAIRNIRYLVDTTRNVDINIGLSSTVMLPTVRFIPDFYDLAKSLGVKTIQFRVVQKSGNAATKFEDLKVEKHDINDVVNHFLAQAGLGDDRCPNRPSVSFDTTLQRVIDPKYAGMFKLNESTDLDCPGADSDGFVDSEGRLWPCFPVSLLSYSNAKIAQLFENNSLLEHDFNDVWYGTAFRRFRQVKAEKSHVQLASPCQHCVRALHCQPCTLPYFVGQEVCFFDCARDR